MTPADHLLFQARMRAQAAEWLLDQLARTLAMRSKYPLPLYPDQPVEWQDQLRQWRDEFQLLALPAVDPVWSDHLTAEFQEAFDR